MRQHNLISRPDCLRGQEQEGCVTKASALKYFHLVLEPHLFGQVLQVVERRRLGGVPAVAIPDLERVVAADARYVAIELRDLAQVRAQANAAAGVCVMASRNQGNAGAALLPNIWPEGSIDYEDDEFMWMKSGWRER